MIKPPYMAMVIFFDGVHEVHAEVDLNVYKLQEAFLTQRISIVAPEPFKTCTVDFIEGWSDAEGQVRIRTSPMQGLSQLAAAVKKETIKTPIVIKGAKAAPGGVSVASWIASHGKGIAK